MTSSLFLEERLRDLAATKPGSFPDRGGGYFERYVTIKNALDRRYFSVAGAALALGGERYTRHDLKHVEDVIFTAGRMLGDGTGKLTSALNAVEPYELFVLLLAILLHDAGNASGREGHEKRAASILRDVGAPIDLEPLEIKLISSIARAHGGRTPQGDKDTIYHLPEADEVFHHPVRPRRLASLLRLADEFSENPRRADEGALRGDAAAPPESVIHNLFCKKISIRFDYDNHAIHAKFDVESDLLARRFLYQRLPPVDILLVDYIKIRLEKCELERRYCSRFLVGFLNYDRIRVTLNVSADDEVRQQITFDLDDRGYPTSGLDWPRISSEFDGSAMLLKHETARVVGDER